MIYASADPLEEKVGNKYTLVILAAKRARQLKEGAMQLSDVNSQNPLSIALKEVAEEKILSLAPPEREETAESLPRPDPIQAVALLASIGDDDELELDEEEAGGEEGDADAAATGDEDEEEPAAGLDEAGDEEEEEEEEESAGGFDEE